MKKSKIEWTEKTWNTVTGCNKVSPACLNCYAERMTNRLQKMLPKKYGKGFSEVVCHEEVLSVPFKNKKPTTYFLNSMSDTFHKDVPDEFIAKMFSVMNQCPQHTFQVLTKRSERLLELAPRLTWTKNIWMGVTVENQEMADLRIPHLLQTPADLKFVSCEPLLEPLDLVPFIGHSTYKCKCKWHRTEMNIIPSGYDKNKKTFSQALCLECNEFCKINRGVSWVILGGETGKNARGMHPDWVRQIRNQCIASDVYFFFKQWGEWGTHYQHNGIPVFKEYSCIEKWIDHPGWIDGGICVDFNGNLIGSGKDFGDSKTSYPIAIMHRIGKQRAGSLLDGKSWKQIPEVCFNHS